MPDDPTGHAPGAPVPPVPLVLLVMSPHWPPRDLLDGLRRAGAAVVLTTEEAVRCSRLQPEDVDVAITAADADAGLLRQRVAWLRRQVHAPVVCMAEPTEVDAATCSGADLVLPGPVDSRAVRLLSRLTTGSPHPADADPLAVAWGPLRLDPSTRLAFWQDQEIHLTAQQFCVLRTLCAAAGAAVSTGQLATALYGAHTGDDRDRVLAHVRRIRRLVELDTERPRFLLTVRGIGFRLADPDPGTPVTTVPGPRTQPVGLPA